MTVLDEDGNYLRRVGCETMTPYPNGIDVSDAGDILVGDSHGNQFHIAVFSKEGRLIGQFTCPTIKVSLFDSSVVEKMMPLLQGTSCWPCSRSRCPAAAV